MPVIDINKKRGEEDAEVSLESAWEDPGFLHAESQLIIPVGRSQDGKNVFIDLTKEKHILAAGGMFSGVGMFRRVALLSLLKLNTPEELKLIIIDPIHAMKDFYSAPHLLFEPATKLDQWINVFNWCMKETKKRLKELGVTKNRNIYTYNETAKQIMPSVVVMISELGDMKGEEMESSIIRVAQMTKATGIHFIHATQRPDEEIITERIKANTPAKIGFQVPTENESNIVMDKPGAEKLIGQGDLLYNSSFNNSQIHLQGFCYPEVDTEGTVKAICAE